MNAENNSCFRCGKPGHRKADCPERRTPVAKTPPGSPPERGDRKTAAAGPSVPPRRPDEEIADSRAWANQIRHNNPTLGPADCGDDSDVYDSEFRRHAGRGPVHLCLLRERAREQITRDQADADEDGGTAA